MRDDFAIFIMVHGRPDKMWTAGALRKYGYTGKIYYVADDLDETRHEYKKKYGDDLLVFNKREAALKCDSGDNSGDLRSTLYAANTIPQLAKEKHITYFMIMCDDYFEFEYKFNSKYEYDWKYAHKLDEIIDCMISYYSSCNILVLAMAQTGDFIGGKDGKYGTPTITRKAMNSFLCSTERPFMFVGRLNEDVTTYVNLGNKGYLFFTITNVALNQKDSQQEKSGLTNVYLDNGTYVKSFFTVMYNPSCVKVGMMGVWHKRIHHKISWNNAVPKILGEQHRKPRTF